jgi:hypothetical protein
MRVCNCTPEIIACNKTSRVKNFEFCIGVCVLFLNDWSVGDSRLKQRYLYLSRFVHRTDHVCLLARQTIFTSTFWIPSHTEVKQNIYRCRFPQSQ